MESTGAMRASPIEWGIPAPGRCHQRQPPRNQVFSSSDAGSSPEPSGAAGDSYRCTCVHACTTLGMTHSGSVDVRTTTENPLWGESLEVDSSRPGSPR